MIVETTTFIKDTLPATKLDLTVCIEHSKSDKRPYAITVGCVDEWLSERDFDVLVKTLNKAKNIRKAVTP